MTKIQYPQQLILCKDLLWMFLYVKKLGYQCGDWYKAPLGVLCAIATGHIMNTLPELFELSDLALFGISLALVIAQLILLPRFIKRIPIKI